MDYQLFIGIDVSKLTIDVAILNPINSELTYHRFKNTELGYAEMKQWILSDDSQVDSHILCCLENTGLYSLPLCNYLFNNNFLYSIQPGIYVKKAMGSLQRLKTDKADAKMLAEYASLYHTKLHPNTPTSVHLLKLRALLSFRERIIKNKVALYVAAKELTLFCKEEVSLFIAKHSNQEVDKIKTILKKIDAEITNTINSDDKIKRVYDLATSVTGIGPQIASYMIIYTNCFTTFSEWRKFACYCGLAPFEYSSGTSVRRKTRTSKKANRKMKAILGNGATSAILSDPEMATYYQKKLKEGKHKLVAINIIKNKLVSRVFATVRRGTPYVKLDLYKQ